MIGGWSFVPGKPVVLGYDSSPLYREDALLHIQHLQMEVEADMKKIKQAENEYAAAEEQLRQRKKESLAGSTSTTIIPPAVIQRGAAMASCFHLTTN